jgi:CelD/BcsL family acetyltransferase involved in cellulose biosynthesis
MPHGTRASLASDMDVPVHTIARTPDEVLALRDRWAQLEWDDIEADLEFFLTVGERRGDGAEPCVVAVERDAECLGMAIGRIERREVPVRIAGRTVVRPRLRCLAIVHGGLAARPGHAAATLQALSEPLRAGDVDAVYLHRVPTDGAFFGAVTQPWRGGRRQAVMPRHLHWQIELPGSFDEYLASLSSRSRSNVRKQARKLESGAAGALEVRRYSGAADRDALFADVEAVAARTYQRGMGVGFRLDDVQRAVLELMLERDLTRAWVVALDGRPVAFEIGHRFGGVFFGEATGYDPDFASHRVGTYVQMRMVEDLCGDPLVGAIDFGYGDAEYKRTFANRHWDDADVLVVARRARPLAVSAVGSAAAALDRSLRGALGDSALAARLRRGRRERARRQVAAESGA